MAVSRVTRDRDASERFFSAGVEETDPELCAAIRGELGRQRNEIELIASENIVSRAVLEAQGSVLTNKYAEGYPGKRYYGGCQWVDVVEQLAIDRAKKLFNCGFANVQPHSGSQANQAAFMATMKPGDTYMGLDLAAGGHLTHGSPVNLSGKWFKPVPYGVRRDDQRIDYDEVEKLAREVKPKVIIAGGSAYPRVIDFARFRQVADAVGAIFMVDMAHFAGLVAGGAHPSPVPHADVVSTTTHKTLRGPRGGMLLSTAAHAKAIDRAVFPGLQGGPHNHTTAGIAIALREAATDEFRRYAHQIVANARALAAALVERGFSLVTGGTDNHLILADLTSKNVSGKVAAKALDVAGLELNYNTVPFDPRKPFDPSGIRLGTPSVTSRGMKEPEMKQIAAWMDRVVSAPTDAALHETVAGEIRELCAKFPAPGILV